MGNKIKYSTGEVGRVRVADDFLPPPEGLTLRGKQDVEGMDKGAFSAGRQALPGHDAEED